VNIGSRLKKIAHLKRRFQAVKVPPPTESDAVRILFGIKERYEKFHAVAYTDEAVESAVFTSTRFIPDRFLPDKAIDLIDEAGARVKLRQTTLPGEVADIQKRIKFIVHRMENAIANHRIRKGAISIPMKSARSARTSVSCAKSTTSTTHHRHRHERRYRRCGGSLDRRPDDGHPRGGSHQAPPH